MILDWKLLNNIYTERKMMLIFLKSLEMGIEMNKMRFNLKKNKGEKVYRYMKSNYLKVLVFSQQKFGKQYCLNLCVDELYISCCLMLWFKGLKLGQLVGEGDEGVFRNRV